MARKPPIETTGGSLFGVERRVLAERPIPPRRGGPSRGDERVILVTQRAFGRRVGEGAIEIERIPDPAGPKRRGRR